MINNVLIFLIVGLRPLLGIAHCRYAVTCTQFAIIQLKEQRLLRAIYNISKRVASCNPLI